MCPRGYFDAAAQAKPLLHLWSLGIEEQFYIVWPILLVLATRLRIWLLPLAFLLLVASFALNVMWVTADQIGTFYNPLTRAWELMIGGALALSFARISLTSRPVTEISALAGAVLIALRR